MGVADDTATLYLIPFALGNFIGPLVLGRLFDTVGRRVMIGGSYVVAGILMIGAGYLFEQGTLSAGTLTLAWSIIFFFASAGASAAYLTVSEVFPLEIRAMAIAFFYAVGTAIGGIVGPILFGQLIGSKSFVQTMIGFLIAAGWLIVAGITAFFLAVDAEQKPLEEVAEPLSAEGGEDGERERRRPSEEWRDSRGWSPRYAYTTADDPLEGQVEALARVAGEADRPLPERELLARTNARHWGPGVGHRALRRAVAEGRLQRDRGGYRARRTPISR
jgi:MFS family permease